MIREHGRDTLFAEHPIAVEHALVQEHAQEAHVVAGGRVQRVAHAVELGVRRRGELERRKPAVLTARADRGQARSERAFTLKRAAGHAEGAEDLFLAEPVDAAPIDGLDRLA